MRALCPEGLAPRDQTKCLAVLVALPAGWPCTQLLTGLFGSCLHPLAPPNLCSSPAFVTGCVQMHCQLLAEPTQDISCKLPPHRSPYVLDHMLTEAIMKMGQDAEAWKCHCLP